MLLSEDEVIAVRNAHPLTRGEVKKGRLLEFPRLIVEPAGTDEIQRDNLIDEEGLPHPALFGSALREFPEETTNPAERPSQNATARG